MMKECDTNNSDTIDFQEFCTLMGTLDGRVQRACTLRTFTLLHVCTHKISCMCMQARRLTSDSRGICGGAFFAQSHA
jgi:hypothetical protein